MKKPNKKNPKKIKTKKTFLEPAVLVKTEEFVLYSAKTRNEVLAECRLGVLDRTQDSITRALAEALAGVNTISNGPYGIANILKNSITRQIEELNRPILPPQEILNYLNQGRISTLSDQLSKNLIGAREYGLAKKMQDANFGSVKLRGFEASVLSALNKDSAQLKSLANVLSHQVESFNSIGKQIAEQFKSLNPALGKQFGVSLGVTSIARAKGLSINNIVGNIAALSTADIVNELEARFIEGGGPEEFEESINKLKNWYDNANEFVSNNPIFLPLFMIALSIIIQLFFYYNPDVSQKQKLPDIISADDKIGEAAKEYTKQEREITRYVVMSRANLRAEPNGKARILSVLNDGLSVEYLDRRKRWLKVRFVDYINGEIIEGWMYYRNLVRLEKE